LFDQDGRAQFVNMLSSIATIFANVHSSIISELDHDYQPD